MYLTAGSECDSLKCRLWPDVAQTEPLHYQLCLPSCSLGLSERIAVALLAGGDNRPYEDTGPKSRCHITVLLPGPVWPGSLPPIRPLLHYKQQMVILWFASGPFFLLFPTALSFFSLHNSDISKQGFVTPLWMAENYLHFFVYVRCKKHLCYRYKGCILIIHGSGIRVLHFS